MAYPRLLGIGQPQCQGRLPALHGLVRRQPGPALAASPEALAPRYVDAMGGIDRVVELAQTAFEAGDFRWAATLLDHAIFTDSDHPAARTLYADTLEQLGYGAENATWRNFFISGATELRDGNFGTATTATSTSMLSQLTPEQIFDSLAISVNGPRSWDLDLAIDITFADLATNYRLALRNGVLVYRNVGANPRRRTLRSSWTASLACWRWRWVMSPRRGSTSRATGRHCSRC